MIDDLCRFLGNKDSRCSYNKDANMNFYLEYGTAIKETLDQLAWQEVQKVVTVLHQAWLAKSQVFIMAAVLQLPRISLVILEKTQQ